MKVFALVLAFAVVVVLGAAAGPKYVPTPGGRMRADCVHHIKSGSQLTKLKTNVMQVVEPSGRTYHVPSCDTSDGFPLYDTNASPRRSSLPADYDGWQAYTQYELDTSFSTFNGTFSTPTTNPAKKPEVLYLFTGLQDDDWVPKVDPYINNFDIIQPVLQYPADTGSGWSVKSWYVTVHDGAYASDEVLMANGDNVFGAMQRTGPTSWYIGSTNTATGKTTGFTTTKPRLASQPWAFVTLELYGAESCDYFPTSPSYFTDMLLVAENGTTILPNWEAFTSPASKCTTSVCKIISPDVVTVDFQANSPSVGQ